MSAIWHHTATRCNTLQHDVDLLHVKARQCAPEENADGPSDALVEFLKSQLYVYLM